MRGNSNHGPAMERTAKTPSRNRMTTPAMKMKNRNLAMSIDAPATFVNPSNPAMIAMTNRVRAQRRSDMQLLLVEIGRIRKKGGANAVPENTMSCGRLARYAHWPPILATYRHVG